MTADQQAELNVLRAIASQVREVIVRTSPKGRDWVFDVDDPNFDMGAAHKSISMLLASFDFSKKK